MKKKMNKCFAFILAVSLVTAIIPLNIAYADEEIIKLTDDDEEEIELTDAADNAKTETDESQTDEVDKTEVIDTIQQPDNTLSRYHSKEYSLLKSLAIIEEDYEADQIVTRGEFAAILTRMMGITDGKAKVFKDVFLRTANSKAIGIVTEKELMNADAEGYFRPKDAITMDDASKALLKLAGYDQIISKYGGEDI